MHSPYPTRSSTNALAITPIDYKWSMDEAWAVRSVSCSVSYSVSRIWNQDIRLEMSCLRALLGSAYSKRSLVTKRTQANSSALQVLKPSIYLLRNWKSAFKDSKLETNLNLIVHGDQQPLNSSYWSLSNEIAKNDLKPHNFAQSKFIIANS